MLLETELVREVSQWDAGVDVRKDFKVCIMNR